MNNNEDKVLINMNIGKQDYNMKIEIPFHQPYFSKNKIDGAIGGNLIRCYDSVDEYKLTNEFLEGANYSFTFMYEAIHNWLKEETGSSSERIEITINSIYDDSNNCCIPMLDVLIDGQPIVDGGEEVDDKELDIPFEEKKEQTPLKLVADTSG